MNEHQPVNDMIYVWTHHGSKQIRLGCQECTDWNYTSENNDFPDLKELWQIGFQHLQEHRKLLLNKHQVITEHWPGSP